MRPLFLLLRLLASRENTVYDKTFEMNHIYTTRNARVQKKRTSAV
jgi:hypothetical protein